MTRSRQRGRRGPRWLAAAALGLAGAALACSGPGAATDSRRPPATSEPAPAGPAPLSTSVPAALPTPEDPGPVADRDAADPVRVLVPAIGVDAPVIPLGLDAAGALEVPQDVHHTGWWTGGPEPGEVGPAVVAGHVDSREGPGVFHQLAGLAPGAEIDVLRADRTAVTFVVERIEQHPKSAFPTEEVYADTPGPELRLITCGGGFDRGTGHYLDNVIVFAARR